MSRGLVVLLAMWLLQACSLGKGYILEPATMNKCIRASVQDGQMTVKVPAVADITINGSGNYESARETCDWSTTKEQVP